MNKQWSNLEVAELLRDLAAALQIKDPKKNKFRIIAYENAATEIEHLSSEIKDLWDENKLAEVPGIGDSLAKNLDELFKTGKSEHFESLLRDIPKAVFDLMKVQGVGPKTAFKLVSQFNISDTNPKGQLAKVAREGKIRDLEGFGEKSEAEILKSVTEFKVDKAKRILYSYAVGKSEEILAWMRQDKNVKRIDTLGSLRRKVSTIGDIDLSVITDRSKEVLNHFVNYPHTSRILEKGEHKASIMVPGEIQIDIRVQPQDSYGSLLQHFTGSKYHNIALREYSLKNGFSLSEFGIKDLNSKTEKLLKFSDEEKFYKFLGLQFIPPELREDTGEIEAARQNKIPKLIELADIKADLQMHSSFDIETSHDIGGCSMWDLIEKGNDLGYEYLAFTEHNPSQKGHTQQQIVNILQKKKDTVDQINSSLAKGVKGSIKKVFNSLEIDILPNGSLPVSQEGLETLDFALVSIHSSFNLSKSDMTKRILSALDNPKVKVLAHPTGRLILKRESIEADWGKIFEFAVKNDKWIEINADSSRLDLPDYLIKDALKLGVKFTLGTDAHNAWGMDNMQFGINNARRGWLTVDDIVNTRSLSQFEKLLTKP
ncbi:MAG: helix-hairpin-helix domain-containing protein [Patescibacteria group bacterium]